MSKPPETLTSILNKLHALQSIGFISFQGVAKATGHHRQDVSHWVTKRDHSPNGHSAIKLRNYTAAMTLAMAMVGDKRQASYRSAYRNACSLFPVNGTKK